MAIRFNNSVSNGTDYNLHNIEKFNGVDYTTTPTLVDESRAIEISNYLPKGNSLVKRNGISMKTQFCYSGKVLYIHNIWQDAITNTKKYYKVYATMKNSDGKHIKPRIYNCYDIEDINRANLTISYSFDNYDYGDEENEDTTDTVAVVEEADLYSYGIYFEGKLFILCYGNYLMTNGGTVFSNIEKVSEHAYIPTIVTGLGDNKFGTKSTPLEQFNLLSNKCKLELYYYNDIEDIENSTRIVYDFGQFFLEGQEPRITKVNGEDVVGSGISGQYFTGLGWIFIENDENNNQKYLVINNIDIKPPEGYEEKEYNDVMFTIEVEFTRNNMVNLVEGMRFGVSYGSYGHRDRLFLSGNHDYPNLDIHSCETSDKANAWKDYTYFGDISYANVGTSDTAIKGYGFLNNGSMAIFKESTNNAPNLYFRNYAIEPDSAGNYLEKFPITISGLSIDVPVSNQIIAYGNDLLVNTPSGIYKIMAGQSTATQTYESVEMSYFIRENLGKNVSNACSIVYDGKLYVSREDLNGKKRVYVADKNRYSFVDGKQVYEWFILDTINVEKFFILNEMLYFSNEKGLYRFNDNFIDDEYLVINDANINGEFFSKEVFVDQESNRVILSVSNEMMKKIVQSDNVKEEWERFRSSTKIQFNDVFYINRINDYADPFNTNERKITIKSTESVYPIYIMLSNVISNANNPVYIIFGNTSIPIEKINIVSENEYEVYTFVNIDFDNSKYPSFALNSSSQYFDFGIKELYTQDNLALSDCVFDNNVWYKINDDESFTVIGDAKEVFFNCMSLTLFEQELDFAMNSNGVRNVVMHFFEPVTSYWRSKFNSLGRLDYLKTIDRMTFVADAIRGGKTNVGYKTTFKKAHNNTGFLYKNELGYKNNSSTTNQLLIMKEKGNNTDFKNSSFSFADVDFSYFTFSSEPFAQTYTSKQKVKNFSFFQLTFESNEPEDSTIVSLTLRYKYTRNNKGVR